MNKVDSIFKFLLKNRRYLELQSNYLVFRDTKISVFAICFIWLLLFFRFKDIIEVYRRDRIGGSDKNFYGIKIFDRYLCFSQEDKLESTVFHYNGIIYTLYEGRNSGYVTFSIL